MQRLLRSPERKTARPGRGKHLLSMIARCGRWLGTLAVAYRGERSEYFCRTKGCVRITQCDVDNVAERVMLVYLARSDMIDSLRAGTGPPGRTPRAPRWGCRRSRAGAAPSGAALIRKGKCDPVGPAERRRS